MRHWPKKLTATEQNWVLERCYFYNYFSNKKLFLRSRPSIVNKVMPFQCILRTGKQLTNTTGFVQDEDCRKAGSLKGLAIQENKIICFLWFKLFHSLWFHNLSSFHTKIIWSHLANMGLLCLCMYVSQQEEQQRQNVAEVDLQFFTVALNHGWYQHSYRNWVCQLSLPPCWLSSRAWNINHKKKKTTKQWQGLGVIYCCSPNTS